MKSSFPIRFVVFALLVATAAPSLRAQADLTIYDDALQNGWQNWSWATVNPAATTPVHSGAKAIQVTIASASSALYLHHGAFGTSLYSALTFWINGGTTGGQQLKVSALLRDVAQPSVPLTAYLDTGTTVQAGAWHKVTIPLSALGAANATALSGIWIQDALGAVQPAFYLDDITLVGSPQPTAVHVTVDARQSIRTVDERVFGLNTAVWDGHFSDANTVAALNAMGTRTLRFPGGSTSDTYHWQTNRSDGNNFDWSINFDTFAATALATNAQVFMTANYGSGTAAEAAAWVTYSNVTKSYGFKYWEIGNECYGSWENDTHAVKQDPYTYALAARDFIAAMKAADPTIKIGVVVVVGEDAYANNTSHPAVNPRTGTTHNGWTPVLLATLKSLGVTPDFLIYHRYEQDSDGESDPLLLQSAQSWKDDAADLRQQLTDYLGAAGAGVELCVTENNSISSNPGKQSTSLVDALYYADSLGNVLKTEFNSLVWWALRNGHVAGNNSPALYGWRNFGDYGVIDDASTPVDAPYPVYYATRLLSHFVRGGDTIVAADSDSPLVSSFAARRLDGSLSVLVINKSPTATLPVSLGLGGFSAQDNATVYSYGIPQDDAVRNNSGSPDVAVSTVNLAGQDFTPALPPYSITLFSIPAATGSTPHLVNLSARAQVGPGNDVLIAGFVIGGSGNLDLLIRGVGPALGAFVDPNTVLADPILTLFDHTGTKIAENDDWNSDAQIASVTAQVGAFGFQPLSKDAALLVTLPAGSYTAQVSGVGGTSGVALAEIYVVNDDLASATRLFDLSARARVGTGNNLLIAGVVTHGIGTKQMLFRAVGPTLASFNLDPATLLAAPVLSIVDSQNTTFTSGAVWGGNATLTSIATQVGAFALPADSSDAVILSTLPVGLNTATVSGANNGTGIAIVEVYDAP